MREALAWVLMLVLCCAAGGGPPHATPEARLDEARAALAEAGRLNGARQYPEARARAEHALELTQAVLGKNHLEVAVCLELLASLDWRRRDVTRAISRAQRALAIRKAALGPRHAAVGVAMAWLAYLHFDQAHYGRAEVLYERALSIQESAPETTPSELAQTLHNFALLAFYLGLSDRAESLYQRALSLREAALGENHHLVAQTLNNLALLYMNQGFYSKAEPLFLRSLAIREVAFGKEHPGVAQSLANLAILYMDQGLYERAEPLSRHALSIQESAPIQEPLLIAGRLDDLAEIYLHQGAYDKAEPLIRRAIALVEGGSGTQYIDVIYQASIHLAVLHRDQGQYDQAEPLYRQALAVVEKAYGKNHVYVSDVLNDLADTYLDQRLYEQAEPLYRRALAIREARYGEQHPQVAATLHSLALLRLAQHRLGEATGLFTHAFTLSEQRLRQEALDFSESRLADFLRYLRADEQLLYSLLRRYPHDPRVQRLALGAVLLLKNRSSEETARISRALHGDLSAAELATFERLRSLRTQLAALSLSGPDSLGPEDYRRRHRTLLAEGDALEAELARHSAPTRALARLPSPARIVDQVAAALPGDAALVEFVAYADRPLVPPPGVPRAKVAPQMRYLAVVLLPGASIQTVDLGAAEPIDQAVSRLRDALTQRDESYRVAAQQLHQLAFQPLLPLLGNTRRLVLSTDGQLSLIPFAALHDGEGFLLDAFDLRYVTSGRDLLPPPPGVASASSVVVLADPDFIASSEGSTRSRSSPALERFFSTLRGDLPSNAWAPLPGTRQEAESIRHLFPQAQLYLGREATKERLLHLPTPGILHLATHGFFLKDTSTPAGTRAVGHFGELGDPSSSLQEPLLRSGIALAGANAPALDASLVTALELAGLNLWGTQLVVLSACDTGRGDVQLGQGVYGLRRALVVAGVETVVMSLWKVDDDATRQLMEFYYRNLLAGQGRAAALREAMRSLRATLPHPHDWAPFIAQGSDAPLRAIVPATPGPR